MQKITSSAGLKSAIQLLEVEQAVKEQLLKEQFHFTYESLKPINILKNTFKNIVSAPSLHDNFLGTIMGLATGYFSKKIFVGTSGNIFRKLFGSVLQFGVTKIVSQHPDTIKSFGQFIVQHFLTKKERLPYEQSE